MPDPPYSDIASLVASYRSHLAKWGIKPARSIEEAFEGLSSGQLDEYYSLIHELEYDDESFYAWITDRRRLGAVHSTKWVHILTSGVWAHLVLRQLCPEGRVLDAGCNAGYWTTWEAGLRQDEVVGIDRATAAVELGLQRIQATGLPGRLEMRDYEAAEDLGEFDACSSSKINRRLRSHCA